MNGHSERFAGINNLMIFLVTITLTGAFAFVFVYQVLVPNAKVIVEVNTFKDVLLIVLGATITAKAMQKASEQGASAALTPPPPTVSATIEKATITQEEPKS